MKISIIGHFGVNSDQLSGQIVKTRIIADALEQEFGAGSVNRYDTKGGIKTLFNSRKMVSKAFSNADNVIILPAQHALQVFAPLVAMQKKKKPHVKIHYVVIGGWLPVFLKTHKFLEKPLKSFDGIYVETSSMKNSLGIHGYSNIFIMPNCKSLNILKEDELVYNSSEPFRLCTFSRVMKEKGIEDAINAVKSVNKQYGRVVYSLDIYGQVESGQTEWFEGLMKEFPKFINYCGTIPSDKSVDIVKKYFALLFPTHFYTEGIPGTIIDALAAGVPVIASKWENYTDIIDDTITGVLFEFGKLDQLTSILYNLVETPEKLNKMKAACLTKATAFVPQKVIQVMKNNLDY